jgi:TPR repeat protein
MMRRLSLIFVLAASLGGCYAMETSSERVALNARALRGDAQAQADLGQLLEKGRGVKVDYVEAADWYRKAAEKGNPDGQHRLGMLFAQGLGVPRDPVAAYMWLSIAAGQPSGGTEAAQSLYMRDRVAQEMTAEQIADGQRRAESWKPKP